MVPLFRPPTPSIVLHSFIILFSQYQYIVLKCDYMFSNFPVTYSKNLAIMVPPPPDEFQLGIEEENDLHFLHNNGDEEQYSLLDLVNLMLLILFISSSGGA